MKISKIIGSIAIPIIAGLVVLGLFFGFFRSVYKNSENTVSLLSYTGNYAKTLNDGLSYLKTNFKYDKLEVYVYTGQNKVLVSQTAEAIFGYKIRICEPNIEDSGWLTDFNAMARLWNLPEINNKEELALFILFHEYRHILQREGYATTDWSPMPVNETTQKIVPPYHLLALESDADHFALIELEKYKK